MWPILFAVALSVIATQVQAVSFCGQEIVRINRIWTGGIFGANKDLYGPIGAIRGQCKVVYHGDYYRLFTERDCVQMVSKYNHDNYGSFSCAQRGNAVDLWDGSTDGNVCYACN